MILIDSGLQHNKRLNLMAGDLHRTCIDLTWWHWYKHQLREKTGIASIVTLDTGSAHLHIVITPTEARTLAANLLAHADEVEAAERRLAQIKDEVEA